MSRYDQKGKGGRGRLSIPDSGRLYLFGMSLLIRLLCEDVFDPLLSNEVSIYSSTNATVCCLSRGWALLGAGRIVVAGVCPHAKSGRAICLGTIVGSPRVRMNSCAVCGSFMTGPLLFRGGGILCRCPVRQRGLVVNGFYSVTYNAGFLFGYTGRALGSLSACAFPLFCRR